MLGGLCSGSRHGPRSFGSSILRVGIRDFLARRRRHVNNKVSKRLLRIVAIHIRVMEDLLPIAPTNSWAIPRFSISYQRGRLECHVHCDIPQGPRTVMTENQLERLREIATLLTAAADNVATTLWYVERDAESKGFQWLLGGAERAAEAQRRLKTFIDEQTEGFLMLDNPTFDAKCSIHGTRHRPDGRCPCCTEEACTNGDSSL